MAHDPGRADPRRPGGGGRWPAGGQAALSLTRPCVLSFHVGKNCRVVHQHFRIQDRLAYARPKYSTVVVLPMQKTGTVRISLQNMTEMGG